MEFFAFVLESYLDCYLVIDSVKKPPQTSDAIPYVDLCLRTSNQQNIYTNICPLISHCNTNSAAESYFWFCIRFVTRKICDKIAYLFRVKVDKVEKNNAFLKLTLLNL